jgi:hypothetical protein
MIGAIEVVARRTVGYGEYLGVTTIERVGLSSCIQRKQLGQPNYEDDTHEDITEAAWDTFHKRLPPCKEIEDTMCSPSIVYLKDRLMHSSTGKYYYRLLVSCMWSAFQ